MRLSIAFRCSGFLVNKFDKYWETTGGSRPEGRRCRTRDTSKPRNAHTQPHVALALWQRPHLELFDNHFFVTATVPALDPQAYRVEARPLSLFVGHNFLVSAHWALLPFVKSAFARTDKSPDLLHHDSIFMLYILCSCVAH